MSDVTDNRENLEEHQERIPRSTFGKTRMIYKLRTQRFYWVLAFLYSAFFNLILLWKYKL